MKIRKAKIKDKKRIFNLLNSDKNLMGEDSVKYSEKWVEEYIKNPIYKTLVIEEDDKIIGLIICEFYKIGKYILFDDIVIDKKYRRKGLAIKLMDYLENLAKKYGMSDAFLFSEVNNKRIHSLLKKLNYKKGKKFYFFSKKLK